MGGGSFGGNCGGGEGWGEGVLDRLTIEYGLKF